METANTTMTFYDHSCLTEKSVASNIKWLLELVRTLKKEQIICFFSAKVLPDVVDKHLNQLQRKHIIKYDKATDCYSYTGAELYKKEWQEKLTKAFWPIAVAGIGFIHQIILNPMYPAPQIFFTTNDECEFGVTVINTRSEALIAERIYREFHEESYFFTHIAIISSAEDAGILKGCGFDDICLIDPVTNNVSYIALEDE